MPLTGDYVPSPNEYVRNQVAEYESSDGVEGGTMQGFPVIILTTLGVKSGNIRKTPLMRVEHDGRYAVIASQGGAPTNPQWYHNLVNHPLVELQDGAVRQDMTAREITGDERDLWWQRAVSAWPGYEEYRQKTERQIPVVVLTPVGG